VSVFECMLSTYPHRRPGASRKTGPIGAESGIASPFAGKFRGETMRQQRRGTATGSWTPDSRIALTSAASPNFAAEWESMARTSFAMYQSYLGMPGTPVEWTDRYELFDEVFFGTAATVFGLGETGQIAAGDLKAIEEQTGTFGIDLVVGYAEKDFAYGALDRGAIFGMGEGEAGATAAAVVRVGYGVTGGVVVITEVLVAKRWTAASATVGVDVAALETFWFFVHG